jgi:hypothetical protein
VGAQAVGLVHIEMAGCTYHASVGSPGDPDWFSIRFRLHQQSMGFGELLQFEDAVVQLKADRVLQERGQQVFDQLA